MLTVAWMGPRRLLSVGNRRKKQQRERRAMEETPHLPSLPCSVVLPVLHYLSLARPRVSSETGEGQRGVVKGAMRAVRIRKETWERDMSVNVMLNDGQ
jgi:hypothetical protein